MLVPRFYPVFFWIDTMRSQVRTTFIAALAFLQGQRLINGLHMILIGTRRAKSLHKLQKNAFVMLCMQCPLQNQCG